MYSAPAASTNGCLFTRPGNESSCGAMPPARRSIFPLSLLYIPIAPTKLPSMAAQFDASEFIDDDFRTAQAAQKSAGAAVVVDPHRAPSREQVDSKVGQMQEKLAELKRVQNELERERAVLEETRRRQVELTTGREEMLHHLTRGIGLLDEAEFAAR